MLDADIGWWHLTLFCYKTCCYNPPPSHFPLVNLEWQFFMFYQLNVQKASAYQPFDPYQFHGEMHLDFYSYAVLFQVAYGVLNDVVSEL